MTDTTNEAIAALCGRLRAMRRTDTHDAAATIEALAAERDAALAEGARQATAAIVADIRLASGRFDYPACIVVEEMATRYERGDHLKGRP